MTSSVSTVFAIGITLVIWAGTLAILVLLPASIVRDYKAGTALPIFYFERNKWRQLLEERARAEGVLRGLSVASLIPSAVVFVWFFSDFSAFVFGRGKPDFEWLTTAWGLFYSVYFGWMIGFVYFMYGYVVALPAVVLHALAERALAERERRKRSLVPPISDYPK